jgi:hypothetical protein
VPSITGLPKRTRSSTTIRGARWTICPVLPGAESPPAYFPIVAQESISTINLPSNFYPGKAGILTFIAHVADANTLKLVFEIRDGKAAADPSTKIGEIVWNGTYYGAGQELLGGAPLASGKILRFQRVAPTYAAGHGQLKVSDVTLWLQANV